MYMYELKYSGNEAETIRLVARCLILRWLVKSLDSGETSSPVSSQYDQTELELLMIRDPTSDPRPIS